MNSTKKSPSPRGRQTRKNVLRILKFSDKEQALERLAQIPDEQLVAHLFSHFYRGDELVKFRSAAAMGELVSRMAAQSMEKARIVLRRIMWNLNDESGGIGWGSPEAMGEILSRNPALAADFKSILFSYLDDKGNFIEHELLQQGVLWGVGTYLKTSPKDLDKTTQKILENFLTSPDPVKRAYALRALVNAGQPLETAALEKLKGDGTRVDIFNGWDFENSRICDMVPENPA